MSSRRRVALVVFVDLDPVPGDFHTSESAVENVQEALNWSIGHYNPQVLMAPPHMQPLSNVEIRNKIENSKTVSEIYNGLSEAEKKLLHVVVADAIKGPKTESTPNITKA